jgi:glycosyltransferase involved in cell wall biosynthesis
MNASATPTRVLHVINGEFYAGAERVQDLLALRLGHHGYDVEFACLKQGLFDEKRQARDAPLHSMPMRSQADLSMCYRLARVVRAEQVRLVHTHSPRSALLGSLVARLARVPMVHHLHSPTERNTEKALRNVRNGLVERLSLRGACRLIVVSDSLGRHAQDRGIAAENIRSIPNGVPVGERARLPYVAGETLQLGTVALFRPRKGIEVLLQAMAELRGSGIPTTLRAVGPFETPEYEQQVHDLVQRLGLQPCVHWTGFRSDMTAEFRRMHVFVLPSLFGEGMPMVVLEAMAAGLPVVSTRVEGIPQVVRDGRDGLLVEPGNPNRLAEALALIAGGVMDTEAMGDSAWQRQRSEFSDLSMAARVAAVYQEVLAS